MLKNKLLGMGAALGLLAVGQAGAAVINGNQLQNWFTNQGAVVNVNTEQYVPDSYWQTGSAALTSSRLLFQGGSFLNQVAFGVYDLGNPGIKLELFSGLQGPFDSAILDFIFPGQICKVGGGCIASATQNFGFYISSPNGPFFYSDSTLNPDNGADHMAAYEGGAGRGTLQVGAALRPWLANEFVLAWEDLAAPGWDRNYADLVVLVESIAIVPEPGSLALLGMGLLALGGLSRRKI